jgi:hypothetical protein
VRVKCLMWCILSLSPEIRYVIINVTALERYSVLPIDDDSVAGVSACSAKFSGRVV